MFSTKFLFGVCVGILGALVWVNRKTISDLWNNRKAVSSGAKVAGGATDIWEGLQGLWGELHR